MTSPPEELKEYLLVVPYPQLTDRIKSMGVTAGEAFRKATHRTHLMTLADKIERTVLKQHGGKVVLDGSGYGVAGHPYALVDMLKVKTTAAGVEALKKVQEIGRISEAIDMKKLVDAPGGGTNIPPGVCWSRP